MAKGNKTPVRFCGCFANKKDARKKAREVGGKVTVVTVRSQKRFSVSAPKQN